MKKSLSLLLSLCLLLGLLPMLGAPAEAADEDYEYAILGIESITITQSKKTVDTDTSSSHYGYHAVDIGGKVDVYAPFTGFVKTKVNTDDANTVIFESSKKVYFADGTLDYMTILLTHCNDADIQALGLKKDKVYRQGELLYRGGTKGGVGPHLHIECARGRVSGSGLYDAREPNSDANGNPIYWYLNGERHRAWPLKNEIEVFDALYLLDDSAGGGAYPFTKSRVSLQDYNGLFRWHTSSKHTHDFNDRGICECSGCLAYSFPDDTVSYASYRKKTPSFYRVTVDGAPLRGGPYKICPAIRTLSAGTELVVTGRLDNAEGNRWYEVQGGGYIYSENVKFTRDGVTLTAPEVSYQPNANEILRTTVNKLSGMTPEKFGCYLLNNTKARWLKGFQAISPWSSEEFQQKATCFEAADPNSGSQHRIGATDYALSVDLANEAGFSLVAGDEYIAQLFVKVDGHYYYSNLVKFIAGIPSSEARGIEPSDSPAALGEAADADAWLMASNTDPLGAQDVSFLYGVSGARGYTVVADYASGGNYCRHNVGSRTDHALRFEQLGDFVCYVVADTPRGRVRTNSVVIHVHDPSGGWTGASEEPWDPGPFCDFSPADEKEYLEMEFVDSQSACLVTRIDKPCGAHIDRCGFTLYDENGETVFSEQWSGDGIPDDYTWSYLWYTIGADSGWLRPETLYYYTFDVIIDGRQFISDRRSFTTLKPLAERLRVVEPVTVDFYGGKDGGFTTERYVPAGATWGWFTTSGGWEPWYEGLPVLADPHADFLGWFTARQGGTQITEDASITATGSIALYAHWQPYTYYLKLDPNGGTVSPTRVAFHDSQPVALPTPTREGYTFLGWFTTPEGLATEIKPDSWVYAGLETLYARWRRTIEVPDVPDVPFTDVAKSSWYYSWVSRAYAAQLINGKSATSFAPNDNITLAEALKLAACVRQLLTDGAVTLQNSASGPWYMSYVDFLQEHKVLGIEIGKATDYQRKITRAEMVRIFHEVIPYDNRAAINDIPWDAIPDVGMFKSGQALYWQQVLNFYRAGILNGSDEYGTFHPDDAILRSAVAAILVRIIDPSTRLGPPAKLGQK